MENEVVDTSVEDVVSEEVTDQVTDDVVDNGDDVEVTEEVTAANEPKMYTVKVNGEELQVTEEELLQGYQTRKAADDKFREAAMTRKQAEEFINLLKTDPKKVLTNPSLGLDFRQLAEEFLVEQLEEEAMDPKDRELRDAKRKLEEYEAEKKRKAQEQEAAQAAELREKYTAEYQESIIDSLQSSGLPKTEHTVKRMAYYLHQGLQRGYNLKAADVVDLVKNDYIQEQKTLFSGLDGDELVNFLGDEVANKLRNHKVSQITQKNPPKTPDTQPQGGNGRQKKSKKISKDDWKAKLERIKNGEE